jgi:F420-0:gamma-glutamyl ligase
MISCTSVSLPYISLAHTWSDEEMRDLITEYIAPLLEDRSVICISSKILSIVEGRYMRVHDSSHKERVAHSLSSHSWRCHASHPLMCVTPSGIFAYAGIDESNVEPGYMVLPLTDPMLSTSRWRRYIQEISGHSAIAVIITDSASQPLRLGTVSRAVGWAGI